MAVRTVYLETFGCQMNELDSELVAGALSALGYRFTTRADEADVVLYNTCSVRERAEQKVWSRLGDLKKRKAEDPGLVVGVLGCMAERDGVGLIERMPVVDVLCGPGELDKLPGLIDNAVRTKESLAGEARGLVSGTNEGNPVLAHRARQGRGEGTPQARKTAVKLVSAGQVALQGSSSRRSATLAAAEDSLELLDLSRSVSPVDADEDGPGSVKRSAYVRITRGCNKFCTYCVVPHTRGAEMHRPPEHIIDECKRLADAGVVEVTLLGQTVNHYRFEQGAAVSVGGVTQPQKGRTYKGSHAIDGPRDAFAGERVTTFADLLRRIHDEVPGILRLRFVTSYPRDFGVDVLEVMRDHPRICRYLHAPAQSGSDRILKMMNRGYTVGEYVEFLDRARAYLDQPELGRPLMLSGDIIVGFPTETDEDFARTKDLVRKSSAKNQFIFKYSPRPGTTAYDRIPDDVPEAVKRARNNELLAVQAEVSDAISRAQVGRKFGVFVEGLSRAELKKRGADVKPGTGMISITVGGRDLGIALLDRLDEIAAGDELVQVSGRTDGDLIVFFDAPAREAKALVGRVVEVEITEASNLALRGRALAERR